MNASRIEERLTEALRARAEAQVVVPPDPALLRRSALPSERRWYGPAAAAAVVAAGGLGLGALTFKHLSDSQQIDTGGTAAPTTPTTGEPSAAGASAGPADPAEGVAVDPSQPPSPNPAEPLEELPPAGSLATVDPADWQPFASPDGPVTMIEFVAGNFVAYDLDSDVVWLTDGRSSWREITIPGGHRMTGRLGTGPGGKALIPTRDDDPSSPTITYWTLDGDELVDPIAISYDPPEQPADHLTWTRVNDPVVAGGAGQLYLASSFITSVRVEELLVENDLIAPEGRICGLEGDHQVIRVDMSDTSTSETECMTAADKRTIELTASDLGIPQADFALINGAPPPPLTVVYQIDPDGHPVPIQQLPGIIGELVVTAEGVTVSTWDNAPSWAVATMDTTGNWLRREVPGEVLLSGAGLGDGYVIEPAPGGDVYRIGQDGDRRLGSLAATDAVLSGRGSASTSGAAFQVDADQSIESLDTALWLSGGGDIWSRTDLSELGREAAFAAVGDGRAMLISINFREPDYEIYVADLPG
jgi:hypothetical protein